MNDQRSENQVSAFQSGWERLQGAETNVRIAAGEPDTGHRSLHASGRKDSGNAYV